MLAVSEEPSSSPRELFGGRLRATSAVIVRVWAALNVSYYRLFIWLPGVLGSEGTVALNVYVLLALVALAQFPGYAASLWLVEAWGRKPTLAAFLALGGLSALTFALARSTGVYVAALFFVGFFTSGPGARSTPTPRSCFPPGCARPPSAWSRASARPPPSQAPTCSATCWTPPRDGVVAHLRGCRHGRRRAGHPAGPGNARREADMMAPPERLRRTLSRS